VLLEILSYARNASLPVERVIAEKHPAFAEIQDLIVQTCKRYAARKRELNLMDFDDLLAFWHEAICRSEEELELERRQWRYILVDEYQDTNLLQSEIVERIAGEAGNLMVVGDDSQSIYSFRGARFENILEFPKRHPSARVFKLEVNYRSTPEILTLANSSIRHNRRQFEKTLRAARPSGVLPEVVAAGDAGEQARFVAQQVLALHDEGLELREIAVLYRAHYQSMELQMELTRLRIPFVVRSGLRFFEQAHVKDVAAYLKIVANPKDELAWKRVLKHVPKVGKATAEKVWRLLERDAEAEVPERLPKAARKGWESLRALLERLRGLRKAPAEMIRAVLEGGYEAYLESAYANAAARMDDLRRLADFALRYADVEALLAELALSSGVAGQDALDVEDAADAVVLSTVHQAKGLEWRAVFVLWAADGKFPDARALKEGGEEEERRLFYVAATRAKDRLAFVYPVLADERFMMGVVQRPSRFLQELDPGTYEKATVTSTPF
jgi:DNA helicase-2/ATP-dependent DNA helicase PcrA